MSEIEQQRLLEFLRGLEDRGIRGTLAPEDIVRRQMERCNIAATYPSQSIFEASVEILRSWLPKQKKDELDSRDDEFTSTEEKWVYKYCCGTPMGTPERPVKDRDGRVISPIKEENILVVDYRKMYDIILEIFEDAKLTWKIEPMTAEIGRVKEKLPLPPATPDFIGEKRDEEWRKKRGQSVRVA